MYKHISSTSNPVIKNAIVLKNKARERKQQQLFIAEGFRELGLALQNGFEATHLLFNPDTTPEQEVKALISKSTTSIDEVISVSQPVFDKIAYRSSVPNVVGIFKAKNNPINSHKPKQASPFYLILEGIEKPGNLGAILRTADAANVDGVFVCEPDFDIYNPNVIRASLGAIFSLPIFELSSDETAAFLKDQKIPILATWLEAAKPLYTCDLTGPTAFVLGAEATGITRFWVDAADERIIIPMAGQVDSLNVSTSTAIVLFEAVRQRIG